MESDLPVNMDKATFLAWAQTRERRCELVDGNVVMIGPNTRAHGLVAGNIATALDAAFDPDRWIRELELELALSEVYAGIKFA